MSYILNPEESYLLKYQTLVIEATSRCNSNCQTCPHYKLIGSDVKDINLDRLKQIIDFYVEDNLSESVVKRIYIGGMGEPLLYSELFDLFKYINVKNPKVILKTVTNGVLLDSYIDDVLDSSLDSIVISLNSFTKKSHALLSGNIFYDRIQDSVVALLKKKKELNLEFPKIGLQFLRTSLNETEEPDFINFWSPYMSENDYFQFRELENQGGKIDIESLQKKDTNSSLERWPCGYLWNTLALDVDLNLYPCCKGFFLRDPSDILKIGNLSSGDIAEVFHSDKFDNYRNAHLNNTYKQNKLYTCLNCDSHKVFYKNNWIELEV